jgi:hypothetical protein
MKRGGNLCNQVRPISRGHWRTTLMLILTVKAAVLIGKLILLAMEAGWFR